ncbi:hypothetical protein ABIB85_004832 [Bradyrhizobium sp. JR1.5]
MMPPAGFGPAFSRSRSDVGRPLRAGRFHVAHRDGANEQTEMTRDQAHVAARTGFRSMLRPARQRNGFAVLHCVPVRRLSPHPDHQRHRMRDPAGLAADRRDGPRQARPPTEVRIMAGKETKPRADIYARITDRIVADLERGVRPWVKPWSAANAAGCIMRPLRHNSMPYHGINVVLLWSEAVARGFTSPIWMTFKQALELGGHIRKGETGTMVVYANKITKTETDEHGDDGERPVPFVRGYTVFCADQIDDLPDHYYGHPAPSIAPAQRLAHVEAFFANTGANIRHGGDKAFFAPALDLIQMPPFIVVGGAGQRQAFHLQRGRPRSAGSHLSARSSTQVGRD